MINVNTFVRGMAWHDIGKPFYLGGEKHSRLGYLWLDALGYPDEALVTLTHYGKGLDVHLRQYWEIAGGPKEAPAVLTTTNALDVVAAALYSFMGQRPPDPAAFAP